MKKSIYIFCMALLLCIAFNSKAQLSGTYNVPTNFTSIAAAVNSLNLGGVSGAVTIEVTAGYTETAPVGGYSLNAITGVSSSNQITFMKVGSLANPLITAYTGTATPVSAEQDGVFRLIGADYITIDGIDIMDPNTTNPATMEFGYGLFKASATNGCQNNTIKNCVVTLSRVNNDAGAGPAVDGSRGIDVVNALSSTHTVAVTVTSAAGANSNNKFYTNTIQNCNIGISLIGFADATPFALADNGNDIGGTSTVTGNTILNYGGGGNTSAAAGVRTLAQYALSVRYNTINSNNGSGIDHAQVLRGIYVNTAVSANVTISNNTVSIHGGGTTHQNTAIENTSGATAATNSITITNNLVTGCTYSTATSGVFYAIYNNGASSASLTISNNTITGNSSAATSGNNYQIYNTGGVTSSVTIANNNINGINYTAATTSLVHRTIYNTGGGSSATVSINSNSIQAITYTGASSGAFYAIHNSATALGQNILNNTFTGLSINTSATSYIINCSNTMPANGVRTVSGNSVVTGFSKTLSGGTLYGYYSYGTSPASCSETNLNNNFSNINVTGATALNVWQSADGPGSAPFGSFKNIATNTFTNITGGTSQMVGIYTGYSNSTITAISTISNNIISNFTCACTAIGLVADNGTQNIRNNSINSFTSSGAATALIGVFVNAGDVQNINKNRIFDLQHTAADGASAGIHVVAGTTNNIYNNLIGDLTAPFSNVANAVIGINLIGGTTDNVYFNTVNLNASSSGTLFGTSAITTDGTPGSVNLRNNIFVNTSTPVGTGVTAAYRRTTTTLTNYANTSNNNLFYAGTPGATRLIFTDGTNSSQTLAAYKTFMATRDAASVTENPTFQSILGPNANFLNISTVIPTAIESGAAAIAAVPDDYAGTTRNATTPDIGAWEGGFTIIPCATANGGILAAATASACAGQTLVATSNGVGVGPGTTFLWKVGATPGGPYAPVSGGTGSTTPSYTSAPLPAGVYYVILTTTCAATSMTAASNEGTLTVNAVPTATAASTTTIICAGQNLVLNGSSNIGTTYSWTGPNAFISSAQNPTISAATSSASGFYSLLSSANSCTSSVATVSVIVNPIPKTLTLTPSSASICAGGSTTLTTTGGITTPTLNFGTQANQNTASTGSAGYPAPYSVYYGGQRMQMLVLASELYAAGFVAGSSITNIQFPVVSKGANWGTTLNHNQNFQVNIGTTNLTTLTSFQSGLVTAAAATNFTPSVGYNNTHTFGTPFVWNGASNIILETVFSNSIAGVAADLVTQYNSPTTFPSTVVYRDDNISAASMATITTISLSYSARPDFKLNGTAVGTTSWTPATGLSGTTGSSVVASPAATTNYTVTASIGSCSTNTNITVNVTPTPTLNITPSASSVCVGGTISLTGGGANTYTWNNNQTTTVITETVSVTTVYTLTGQNASCPSVSTTISIVANPLPTVVATAVSSLVCAGQTSTLTATGASTYSWTGIGTGSMVTTAPTSTTVYNVIGTDLLGCTGTASVTVNTNIAPAILIAPTSVTVCASSAVSFTASGGATYLWSSGTPNNNAVLTVSPTTNTTYTVTGTNAAGCTGTAVVTANTNALPPVAITPPSLTICAMENASVTASGAATYTWSTGDPNAALTLSAVASSTVLTVTATDVNTCKNTASVTITVDACTGIGQNNRLDNSISVFPNPSTGMITTKFEFEGTKEILITNSVGAVIHQSTSVNSSESFDLSGLAKGIYFVRVSVNGSSVNQKIVIQ